VRENYKEYTCFGRRTRDKFELIRDKYPIEREGY